MSNTVCNCGPRTIYVGGPYYNDAERKEQERIARNLQQNGFLTYLPQRDGLDINKVITVLISEGKTAAQASELASQMVFQYEVYNLIKCAAIVVNSNEVEPESGTVTIASVAFSACMPVILYKDDIRTFSTVLNLNPMYNSIKTVPVVTKIYDLPAAINTALPKKDCKCISIALQNVIKAGSLINKSKYK